MYVPTGCPHRRPQLRNAATGERLCGDCGSALPPLPPRGASAATALPPGMGSASCPHVEAQLRNAATGERVCVLCGAVAP